MDQERIGKFILEARHEVGFTQKELAARIGGINKEPCYDDIVRSIAFCYMQLNCISA